MRYSAISPTQSRAHHVHHILCIMSVIITGIVKALEWWLICHELKAWHLECAGSAAVPSRTLAGRWAWARHLASVIFVVLTIPRVRLCLLYRQLIEIRHWMCFVYTVKTYCYEHKLFSLFSAKSLVQRCLRDEESRRNGRQMLTVVIVAHRYVILEQNGW